MKILFQERTSNNLAHSVSARFYRRGFFRGSLLQRHAMVQGFTVPPVRHQKVIAMLRIVISELPLIINIGESRQSRLPVLVVLSAFLRKSGGFMVPTSSSGGLCVLCLKFRHFLIRGISNNVEFSTNPGHLRVGKQFAPT